MTVMSYFQMQKLWFVRRPNILHTTVKSPKSSGGSVETTKWLYGNNTYM